MYTSVILSEKTLDKIIESISKKKRSYYQNLRNVTVISNPGTGKEEGVIRHPSV